MSEMDPLEQRIAELIQQREQATRGFVEIPKTRAPSDVKAEGKLVRTLIEEPIEPLTQKTLAIDLKEISSFVVKGRVKGLRSIREALVLKGRDIGGTRWETWRQTDIKTWRRDLYA